MASARHIKNTKTSARRGMSSTQIDSPALSIASAVVGALGLICGYMVSWIASIVLGIAAAVLGVIARRKGASLTWLANIGVVLGIICIVSSFVLVAVVSFQMIRLGLVS